MSRLATALMLSAALLVPFGLQAQDRDDRDRDHDRDEHVQRYYDTGHRDYHVWNANENRAYHEYWEHHHRRYRDYDRLSRRQQRAYWEYRHQYPDVY